MSVDLPVDRVVVLDGDFGTMAVEAGGYAMSVPGLTLREKVLVWLANDVCNGHLGVPYELHLTLGLQAGMSWQELREVLRHLAPYAGYPAVVQAFVRMREFADGADSTTSPSGDPAGEPPALPDDVDGDFAGWLRHQEESRWQRPLLTARERALLCVVVDVFHQTLGEPFRAHVEAAKAAGADEETLRNLLRLMSELGAGKVWQALAALNALAG
ncbi:carboxymuconolactone decarboxylase family protein [Nonomuraea angiospora]|uniref:Alkylhydroperoxidase/carboxymuconolactone decarboxylase family protein YurZ n=1 Tax=Nonomuraea angiospora TaxID=46172 RepID=A0ABR9LSY3_9ACTN|nr:carboxymuconolactone decarboxylase family protein [Nonomuraea angiospora]MBE1583774.1 alkylhydroperoxidase/carboxymuconolactone decarboxylase family protein YurZ [Nonomuraea angiospora]